jgi:Domain of unknown function (DUF4160)
MLSLEDELFLMSNLARRQTGLPFVVWIFVGAGIWPDAQIKISRGPRPRKMVSLALRPTLRVIEGELTREELALLEHWVTLNREALLAYWNAEIDASNVLKRLRKV